MANRTGPRFSQPVSGTERTDIRPNELTFERAAGKVGPTHNRPEDELMTTIREVAKRADVSAMTVSRVLNNSAHISRKARQRVEAAIAELGYVPNALARSLRFKQTNTLALVLTDITNPFFTTVARGVEDAASDAGFNVIFCNTDESEGEQRENLTALARKQVDGVLLVPARSTPEALVYLQERHIPVVILDRRIEHCSADSVRCDSEGGAYRLTRLLLDQGHSRIAILTGSENVSTAVDRVTGYRRALDEAGIAVDESYSIYGVYPGERRSDGPAGAETVPSAHSLVCGQQLHCDRRVSRLARRGIPDPRASLAGGLRRSTPCPRDGSVLDGGRGAGLRNGPEGDGIAAGTTGRPSARPTSGAHHAD